MKNRLVGGAIAAVIAVGVLLVPSPAPVEAASSSCTGWTSRLVPPTTIRVLRTATRRTQTVNFRTYVEKVMPAEWGASHPAAALQAGAVAVKQYAWFYALSGRWRGGRDAAGRCYDVRDDSNDQVYNPAKVPARSHLAAVAATWTWSVRRNDVLALTGYRPGTSSCPGTIDGYRLYQRNASACAKKGWTAEQILRKFYSPRSRPAAIVVLGRNDMTGDWYGDAAGLTTDEASGEVVARLYTADPSVTPDAVVAASTRVVATLADGSLLGRGTADVNADGRQDIVQLVAGADDTVSLEVMKATGSGFASRATWWTSTAGQFAAAGIGLVTGDFNADGKGDAGILQRSAATADAPGQTALWVAPSTRTAFAAPILRLSAARDLFIATAISGDFTGDGRADVAFLLPDGDPAITRIEVAASKTNVTPETNGNLAAPVLWLLEPAAMATIKAVAGDIDRTGRDDLFLVRQSGEAARILAAVSTGAAFTRRWVYTDTANPIPWSAVKPVASDTTRDGRTDLLLVVDRGRDGDGVSLGVTIIRLRSYGTYLGSRVSWKTDPAADWTALDPY